MRNRRKYLPTVAAFSPREEETTKKARECIAEIRQALKQFHTTTNFIFESKKRNLIRFLNV